MKRVSIEATVLTLLFVLLLIGVGVFSVVNYRSENAKLQETLQEKIDSSRKVFFSQLNHEKEALTIALDGITRIEPLLEILSKKDRNGLLTAARPLFEQIKEKFKITHLYFIDPSGSVFLRVHQPGQYGDALQRPTFAETKRTGKVAVGIDMGKEFFSIRAVQPVSYNGAPAG